MPELPDVEVFRRYLQSTALHKKIAQVEAQDAILEGVSARHLAGVLEGTSIEETRRHGKHLFARTGAGDWIALHFGMTGYLRYYKKEDRRPEHARMVLALANGYHLAYVCPRKLGTVRLVDSPEEFAREMELGPDALSEDLDRERFIGIFRGTRSMAKSALMNQKLVAGLGNVYSDEVLYQARIHPRKKVRELPHAPLRALHDTMREVLRAAIEAGADPEKMPAEFILPRRHTDRPCPCGGPLEKIEVSGRNGFYCPHCQSA